MRHRLKLYLIFAAVALMLAAGCSLKEAVKDSGPLPADEKTQAPVPDGVYKARDAVLGYFIPASADILSVEGRNVKVRPVDEANIKKGMRFSVFRKGAPFYHPVTNELIGSTEDTVGGIEITGEDAVDGVYPGMIIRGDVREGDKARISSSRIKIAFFQDRKADWSVSEVFYGSLKDSGRFEFVETYTADYSADAVSKLAREHGAEASLVFSTPDKDGKSTINVKLYWAGDSAMGGEITEETGSAGTIPARDEEFISGVFKDTKPWRTYGLPGGLLVAMGDVDGNGTDEFVVSDGRDIRIYSVKEDFKELWNIKTEGGGNHLSLDILDVNNNGRAEIFVTSADNIGAMYSGESESSHDVMSVNSFVLEYDPAKGYRRIAENIPYFLRTVGNSLLMQRYSSGRIFSGPVYRAKWTGSQYGTDAPLALPEAANIYGFAFADWKNDGRSSVMTYDYSGYLCLYDDSGSLIWKSEESYGPFTFSFESRTRSLANPTTKWSVRGRLMAVKTGRGQEIIAVRKEPVLSMLPALGTNKAEVYSLWWDGNAMDRKLIMNEIYGSVTDYLVNGRELFLVARAGLSTFLGRLAQGEFSGSSILFYYKFGPLETENK